MDQQEVAITTTGYRYHRPDDAREDRTACGQPILATEPLAAQHTARAHSRTGRPACRRCFRETLGKESS